MSGRAMQVLEARRTRVAPGHLFCGQCWQEKPLEEFIGARGLPTQKCLVCQERTRGYAGKTTAEKMSGRRRIHPAALGRVRWIARSNNRKLGPIPVTMSERGTCPPSCGLFEAGCYAMYGFVGKHWKRTQDEGISWATFLRRVAELPEGTLWRHNEAGDLPGEGEQLHAVMLLALVRANVGRRGFTFTHKHGTEKALELVAHANRRGFTVNLSADTLEDADRLAQSGGGLAGRSPAAARRARQARDARRPQGRRLPELVQLRRKETR